MGVSPSALPGNWSRLHCNRALCPCGSQLPNGRYAIRNSVTASKDQTYALYNLTQEPAGTYADAGWRLHQGRDPEDCAGDMYLPVAHKADSQDICFVPDGDYAGLLTKRGAGPDAGARKLCDRGWGNPWNP